MVAWNLVVVMEKIEKARLRICFRDKTNGTCWWVNGDIEGEREKEWLFCVRAEALGIFTKIWNIWEREAQGLDGGNQQCCLGRLKFKTIIGYLRGDVEKEVGQDRSQPQPHLQSKSQQSTHSLYQCLSSLCRWYSFPVMEDLTSTFGVLPPTCRCRIILFPGSESLFS